MGRGRSAGALASTLLLAAAAHAAAPAAAAVAACRPGFSPIPMKALASGHHAVSVMLNGKPAAFLVDTGAGATIIHAPYLARFALSPASAPGTASNVSGKVRFDQVAVTAFAVGGTRTRLSRIYAMDLSYLVDAINLSSSDPIQGLVGQDVLRDQKAVIDVDKSILYLADPDASCGVIARAERPARRSGL